MSNVEWHPACSFCDFGSNGELVRAGERDCWICSQCVDQPIVEDSVAPGTLCTFCEQPVGQPVALWRGAARTVAGARRGVVICSDCLPVCVGIVAEDRALRGETSA